MRYLSPWSSEKHQAVRLLNQHMSTEVLFATKGQVISTWIHTKNVKHVLPYKGRRKLLRRHRLMAEAHGQEHEAWFTESLPYMQQRIYLKLKIVKVARMT